MASFKFVRNQAGGNFPPLRIMLPVNASETLKYGDAVSLNTDGKITRAATATSRFLGVMAQDSNNAAGGALVNVFIAMPFHVWRASASADASTHVNNGTRSYDINATQQVDVADTTGGVIQIVDIDESSNTTVDIQFTACHYG